MLTPERADEIRFGSSARIATQEVSQHRWYTKQLVVFLSPERETLGFYYMDPATEMQEGQDEYDLDADGNVPTFPVEGHKETITVWEVKAC
jgi:hypothetical protein